MAIRSEYPRGHMTRIMGLHAITFLVGMGVLATPFAARFFPGDIDTTTHVALGALIAVLAAARVLVAYGSIWMDVVLFFLGLLVFQLPTIMHMHWFAPYATGHMAAGGIVMAISVISAILTIPVVRSPHSH